MALTELQSRIQISRGYKVYLQSSVYCLDLAPVIQVPSNTHINRRSHHYKQIQLACVEPYLTGKHFNLDFYTPSKK